MKKIDGLDARIAAAETHLLKRIYKLGLQIARLEDDTATKDEFDNLDIRIRKLEQLKASA